MLHLSRFCQPQVWMGEARMIPANMDGGADRIAYARGLLRYAELIVDASSKRGGIGWAATVLSRVPFASELIRLEDDGRVTLIADVEDRFSFRAERLSVLFVDGRRRALASTIRARWGRQTPRLSPLVSALFAGASKESLLAEAKDAIAPVLDALETAGLIDDGPRPLPPLELDDGEGGDRLSWFGHATLSFRSGATRAWIDPVLPPAIALTDADRSKLLSSEFAESRWMADYANGPRMYGASELPRPDIVCITHQDRDHLDLGTLMALPASTPIVVPRSTGALWDVDMPRLIERTLGARKVIVLGHGERIVEGDLEICALPFVGEMPSQLRHGWNVYLVEGRRSAVLAAADARIQPSTIDALTTARRGRKTPLTVCAGPMRPLDEMPGWREGLATPQLWNSHRLWGWYTSPIGMFTTEPCSNVTPEILGRMRDELGLVWYFPYAVGSVPWIRITDPEDALSLEVTSLSVADLDALEARLPEGVRLFPITYGRPVSTTP